MNDDEITIKVSKHEAEAAGAALAREAARLRGLRAGGDQQRWRNYEADLLDAVAARLGFIEESEG